MFKKVSRGIKYFYWRCVASPENYARHIGVKIGRNCFISTRRWGTEPYLITIGDNVQVTHDVAIHTHGGGHALRDTNPDFDVFGKVVIQDWAYIGASSQIMPGVTVGKGAIVAAGSIVTKSVAPYTVVGGNPAKYICSIQEYAERNMKFNVHSYGLSSSKKRELLLSLPDDRFIKK